MRRSILSSERSELLTESMLEKPASLRAQAFRRRAVATAIDDNAADGNLDKYYVQLIWECYT